MAMQTGGGGSFNSDINVTPLVDVVLVLLIIFMVIVPLTQRAYDIQIPKEAQTIEQPKSEEQVILGINGDDCPIAQTPGAVGLPPGCSVRLNRDLVRVEDLAGRIGDVFRNRRSSDRILFLAAEEKLNYEGVIRILDVAQSGVEELKVGLVTDETFARPPQQ
jgi:biopolymer transport protein ExbD